MANIARGEAECYISIKAECRVLYFPYSTWQGSDLSVIKNFLPITKHIKCADYVSIHHVKSGQTHCVVTFTILSIAVSTEESCLKFFRFLAIHVSGWNKSSMRFNFVKAESVVCTSKKELR